MLYMFRQLLWSWRTTTATATLDKTIAKTVTIMHQQFGLLGTQELHPHRYDFKLLTTQPFQDLKKKKNKHPKTIRMRKNTAFRHYTVHEAKVHTPLEATFFVMHLA
jgi:hypothetical protein